VALATLLEIGESPSERRVLIPASDEVMHLVSRNRDALARHYGFVLPPPDVVDLLLEKTRFHVWASHQGFAVPETHIAETEGELAAILRDVRYPVVLKPLSHTPEWEAKSPNHKVYKLYSREDLDAVGFPLFEAAPQFIVQRWIEGGDDCVHFCLTYVNADGREAGVYTGRKYLQWPPQVGSTAICVGEENPNLLELTRAVWRAAGFRGLGSVEAKYCAEDGRYYIIEPTVGRNNLQSYVAVAGGVNMTRLALEDALGRPTVATCPARSAVWINEPFAVLAVREAFARRKPERRTLRRLFTSRRPVAFAHVRWTDPFPFVALLWENLRRLGASLLRRTPPVQPPEGPVAARSTEADVHEMTGRS
jgi:predicted ATP-grasp superfamily ATP-dependent carboligase